MLGADYLFWLANNREIYTPMTFDVIIVKYNEKEK